MITLEHAIASKTLNGLFLLPVASGGVGRITGGGGAPSECLVAASDNQRSLLPGQAALFVHPDAVAALPALQSHRVLQRLLGVVKFSPAILAAHVHHVLPPAWKCENFVVWRQGGGGGEERKSGVGGGPGGRGAGGGGALSVNEGPSAEWMKLFWSEVSISDPASVNLFHAWPLIPIRSGELVSCSLASSVLCLPAQGGGGGQ